MTDNIIAEATAAARPQDLSMRFVFEALERAGVRYALLRGFDELSDVVGNLEIDLLAHPADVKKMAQALAELDFVELPDWGHAPHRFFVAFSKETGAWLKLDVVTALYYGRPYRHLKLDLLAECLRNSIVRDGIPVISERDEFLTLLLHCLLDKGKIDAKHRQRLQELASRPGFAADNSQASDPGRFRNIPDYESIVRYARSGDWPALLALEAKLQRFLLAGAPWHALLKRLTTAFARRFRPVLFLLLRHGVSVVLLAPDGAGKSTLAASLVADKFLRARLVYMGTNVEASTVGFPFTPGLFAELKNVNKSGRRNTIRGLVVRGLNFVNKLAEHWYRCLYSRYQIWRGRFVIFDRFIYDGWIQKRKQNPWKRLRKWMFDAACPEPDLVVFLDAPGEVLFARKGEHSAEWIDQQREGYHKLSQVLRQMVIVDASQAAEQVRQEVTSLIWSAYGAKSETRE